jgi:hypothetical protein
MNDLTQSEREGLGQRWTIHEARSSRPELCLPRSRSMVSMAQGYVQALL